MRPIVREGFCCHPFGVGGKKNWHHSYKVAFLFQYNPLPILTCVEINHHNDFDKTNKELTPLCL